MFLLDVINCVRRLRARRSGIHPRNVNCVHKKLELVATSARSESVGSPADPHEGATPVFRCGMTENEDRPENSAQLRSGGQAAFNEGDRVFASREIPRHRALNSSSDVIGTNGRPCLMGFGGG